MGSIDDEWKRERILKMAEVCKREDGSVNAEYIADVVNEDVNDVIGVLGSEDEKCKEFNKKQKEIGVVRSA